MVVEKAVLHLVDDATPGTSPASRVVQQRAQGLGGAPSCRFLRAGLRNCAYWAWLVPVISCREETNLSTNVVVMVYRVKIPEDLISQV